MRHNVDNDDDADNNVIIIAKSMCAVVNTRLAYVQCLVWIIYP